MQLAEKSCRNRASSRQELGSAESRTGVHLHSQDIRVMMEFGIASSCLRRERLDPGSRGNPSFLLLISFGVKCIAGVLHVSACCAESIGGLRSDLGTLHLSRQSSGTIPVPAKRNLGDPPCWDSECCSNLVA